MILQAHTVSVGGQPLDVEVASKEPERELGLMYRSALPDGRGMLFIWNEAKPVSIRMLNCYIPLDVAFFDDRRRLLRAASLRAYAPREGIDRVACGGKVKYVVETPVGWFGRQGLVTPAGKPVKETLLDLPPGVERIESRAD